MRLLPPSSTQRLPLGSKARLHGVQRPSCVGVLHPRESKSGLPITTLASCPVEKGGSNSSTRLPPASATQRLPALSKATSEGLHRPFCDTLQGPLMFPKRGL